MKSPARYIADFVISGNNILDASVTLADLGPDVLANLASAGANIAGLTTSNIAEGSNLYYTNERVYANINPLLANITGISVSTATVNESGNLIITLTDATQIDAGYVVGPEGDDFDYWDYYESEAALLADTPPRRSYSIINSSDADNGKVYLWDGVEWTFVFNLSGPAGANGTDGTNGVSAGLRFIYNSGSGYQDPGDGKFSVNRDSTPTFTSTTRLIFSYQSADGIAVNTLISRWDDNTTQTNRGVVMISKADGTQQSWWYITGAYAVAGTGFWNHTPATFLGGNTAFTNGEEYFVTFVRNGDKGDTGATGPAGADGTDGTNGANGVSVSTATVNESGNLIIILSDTSNVDAGYVVGPQGEGANLAASNTDALAEGITNLYYTDERVYANVSPLLFSGDYADLSNTPTIPSLTGYATESFVNTEIANLINSAPEALDTLNELALALGNDASFSTTVTNSIGNVQLLANAAYNQANAAYDYANTIVVYTDADAYANISPLLANLDVGANLAESTTDDLAEGSSNLYFTNARVVAALTAGEGITVAANGLLTGTASNTTVYLSSQTLVANGNTTDFTLSAAPGAAQNIMVAVNGVIQIPTTDYTVSSTTLSFTTAPTNESNIEVRYFLRTEEEYASVSFTTSNIAEGSNLYYTDERVYANISPLLANLDVGANLAASNTDALAEGTTNLYYTDERVYANISPLLFSGEYSDLANTPNLFSGSYEDLTNTPTIPTATSNLTNDSGFITSAYLTTSNVIEGTNLYYTNARVTGNVVDYVLNAPNVTIGNAIISGTLTTPNFSVSDTLTIGSQIIYAQGNNGFSVNEDFDASNSNLQTAYHYTSGSGRETVVFSIARTAQFTNGFGITGTSSDNKFVTFGEQNNTSFEWRRGVGIRPINLTGGTLLANLSSSGAFFTAGNITAPYFVGNVVGYATESYVDNAVAGAAGYTDADAYANISPLLYNDDKVQTKLANVTGNILPDTDITYDIGSANLRFRDLYLSGNSIHLGDIVVRNVNNRLAVARASAGQVQEALPVSLSENTTDDLTEGNNLYFTNARVYANVAPLIDAIEQYSNAKVYANVAPLLANIPAGYTDEDAYANISPLLFSGDYTDLTNKPNIPSLDGYATESYVDGAVANLVNSAPSTLDTLNELATALGNDADFSNTVVTSIATKASNAYVQAELSALSDYVMNTVSGIATFSGDYNDLTNKPTIPSLSGYATEAYVDNATANVSVNLAGYATEAYVDSVIANIQTGSIVTVSDTAPASANVGDIWIDTENGVQLIYFDDGDSGQWVDMQYTMFQSNVISGGGGGGGTSYDTASDSTGYFGLPVGTTAERPGTPAAGMLRFNSTLGFGEIYNGNVWGIFGALPPTISTVSPSTYTGNAGTSFDITGTNFSSDASVIFILADGSAQVAASYTFVNNSLLQATTSQSYIESQGPLDVRVIQASGISTKADCIGVGYAPLWTTEAALGNVFYSNTNAQSVSFTLEASDVEGTTVTYSASDVATLPPNLSIDANTGVLSGNLAVGNASVVTNNFGIVATDATGKGTTRVFNIIRRWNDGTSALQPGTSALQIKNLTSTNENGLYYITLGNGRGVQQVYCVMDSSYDGGGYMMWYGNKPGTTSGTYSVSTDRQDISSATPMLDWYSLSYANRSGISAISTEGKTLIGTHNGTSQQGWAVLERVTGTGYIWDSTTHSSGNFRFEELFTMTSSTGALDTSVDVGLTNYSQGSGGDLGIAVTTLDHHNTTSYYNLNTSCGSQFIYQYGAGYKATSALTGFNTVTTACASDSTNAFGFWIAQK